MNVKLKPIIGDGSGRYPGSMRRRMALVIDDVDVDVINIELDKSQTVERQVKKWSDEFKIDADLLRKAFRTVKLGAAAEAQKPKRDAKTVRGTESDPAPPITLEQARKTFNKWLVDVDHDLPDVIFGTVMAHRLEGDPAWTFIVDGPGSTKTEYLRALAAHDDVVSMSTLTPGTLISGYVVDEGQDDPSLLPKLDGKILTIKDFTTILEMASEARQEILGTLRDAYDGEAGKAFGTGEFKKYKSRFGILAAVTPAIEAYWGVSSQLGERFLRFRPAKQDRKTRVRRAMANSNNESAMRDEISRAAMGVLAQTPAVPSMPDDMTDRMIALADFVSLARSEVARDRQGVVKYVPAPEVGTRVGKVLKKLAQGIAMARGDEVVTEDVYRIIRRVADSTIPSMRADLIRALWDSRQAEERTATIAEACDHTADTAKVWLSDLWLLGMVDRRGDKNSGYTWILKPDFQATIAVCGVYEGAPPETVPLTETAPETAGYDPLKDDAVDDDRWPDEELPGLAADNGNGHVERKGAFA